MTISHSKNKALVFITSMTYWNADFYMKNFFLLNSWWVKERYNPSAADVASSNKLEFAKGRPVNSVINV